MWGNRRQWRNGHRFGEEAASGAQKCRALPVQISKGERCQTQITINIPRGVLFCPRFNLHTHSSIEPPRLPSGKPRNCWVDIVMILARNDASMQNSACVKVLKILKILRHPKNWPQHLYLITPAKVFSPKYNPLNVQKSCSAGHSSGQSTQAWVGEWESGR